MTRRAGSPAATPPVDETPRPRDRAATEERILAAVGTVLARKGFAAIGITAIAREAGVDKVLIYRYFGGLPELLRVWGGSGRFWPTVDELLGPEPDALRGQPAAERLAQFFDRFVDALRARPMTLEILAAELVERNELTAILEAEREEWGRQLEARLGGPAFAGDPPLRGTTLLLAAGVQYLLLRSRKVRLYAGLNLDSKAAWTQLKAALRESARRLLPPAA